jgi:DNA-binding response OmpR family regulator
MSVRHHRLVGFRLAIGPTHVNSPANRILVVEDDPDVGVLLERVLSSAGYQVDRATTASGARLLVEAQEYRLVLADGILPDGTGIDVADAAKARGMKALIITGYGLRLSRLGGFDRHDFILKPIRPGPLIELIANYLSRPST